MKRSEFKAMLADAKHLPFDPEEIATSLDDRGEKWDPEVVRLPRLCLADLGSIFQESSGTTIGYFYDRWRDLGGSVIDAYNRLQAGELVDRSEIDTMEGHIARLREELAHVREALEGERTRAANLRNDLESERRERAALIEHLQPPSFKPRFLWPADVVSKTRGAETVHYAIGPARATREAAAQDLRLWFDRDTAP